jgi:hypothetical protein
MMMEVAVRRRKKDGGLDVGVPRMLFTYREDESLFRGRYGLFDVDDENDRFLLLQGPEGVRSSDRLLLVVPWSGGTASALPQGGP